MMGTKLSPLLVLCRHRPCRQLSRSFASASATLLKQSEQSSSPLPTATQRQRTALVFPGQGSQLVGMGRDFYDSSPAARAVFNQVDEALGEPLSHLIFDGPARTLELTRNAQPAILATSIAIVRAIEEALGKDRYISQLAAYSLGHSLGEYSALVATGSLKLADAARLVRLRGEAMQAAVDALPPRHRPTAMTALVLPRRQTKESKEVEGMLTAFENVVKDVQDALEVEGDGDIVQVANLNSSFQVVISGTKRGVDIASRALQDRRVAARAVDLPVSAPFHCSLMAPAADALRPALDDVPFAPPASTIVANVTARPIANVNDIPTLLVRQATAPVQWHRSVMWCKNEAHVNEWISVGPGRVISNLLKKELPAKEATVLSVASPDEVIALCDHFKSRSGSGV
ncbi:FabD/lysophospholipase-like protein [Ramicandelaber brevisporus]|nr:FabD/lysophospholipase-like protein [Ramicandelaber brevisporus]